MQSGGAPKDKYWLVYYTFVLLGVAFLLPWNTFITETAFIGVRVRQPPYFPHVADSFESLIATVFQTMNLLSVLSLPAVQRSVTLGKQVTAPIVASAAVLVAMAGLAAWPAASGRTVAGLALASVALVGACSGVLQSGIFSLASCLPPIYVQGASLGMGVAGLFTALLSFGTALATPPGAGPATARELGPAALAYFAVSAAVIVAALAAYLHLPLSRFWRAFSGLKEAAYGPSAAEALLATTRGWDAADAAAEDGGEPGTPCAAVQNGANSAGELGEPKRVAGQADGGPRAGPCGGLVAEWHVLGRTAWGVRSNVAALFLTFLVTLAVFPGVTALICSVRNPATAQPCAPQVAAGRLFGDLWAPALFVLYNAGDVAGRAAAGAGAWAQRSPRPDTLLVYAALRVLVAAPFLWCRVVTGQPWALPTLLRSDAFPVALITLLGITNGHLASVTAMHLPTFLPVEIRDRSGMIMTFTVTAGLSAGSILSYILVLAL